MLDSYAYDPAGLLAAATDAMGRATNYFYDGDQELIATQTLTLDRHRAGRPPTPTTARGT